MTEIFTFLGYFSTPLLIIVLVRNYRANKRRNYQTLVDIDLPDDTHEAIPTPGRSIPLQHNLSPVQEEKVTFLFNLLDFNRNGYLTRDDIVDIADNMAIIKAATMKDHHIGYVRKFMERSWTHLSHVEKDHFQIPLNEWLHFTDKEIVNCESAYYMQHIERLVRLIFLFFDDDKDKYLNLNEYMSLLVSFRADFRSAKMSFEMLDANQDGLISQKELLHAVWAFFHSSDPEEKGNWLFGEWRH